MDSIGASQSDLSHGRRTCHVYIYSHILGHQTVLRTVHLLYTRNAQVDVTIELDAIVE